MKYSEHAIDEAITAIQESSGASVTEEVLAVFDSLGRAPWWEEVEVGYEFRQGEPYRVELSSGVASEHTTTYTLTISTARQATYFRDTRWTPPVTPLKVGDLIETEEQAESLPIGTIAVSPGNTAFRKVGIGAWQRVGGKAAPFADRFMAGDGDRIIYLPRGDSA